MESTNGWVRLHGDTLQTAWRRERDSNPRYGFSPYNALAGRPLRPLGHHSGGRRILLRIEEREPPGAVPSGSRPVPRQDFLSLLPFLPSPLLTAPPPLPMSPQEEYGLM